ncbi:MAG TPA: hypothetical protein ENI69_01870 [Rhodospirillales bacterium]|nr:hypothetical protein [Rhodospirillales bacterium]
MTGLIDRKNGRNKVTTSQIRYLMRGAGEPGGKLPLFDGQGQKISDRTVRSCISKGWAEPWFDNPLKPDWSICKLTESGRALVQGLKK